MISALFMLDDGYHVWLWQGWWPRGEDGELEPAERNAGKNDKMSHLLYIYTSYRALKF